MEQKPPPEPEKSSLRPLQKGSGLPSPVAAMAEALRANAEALRRLHAGQQRLSEAVEKGERAQQVVTSTRALNETFRGLSEIQRGLLDAVVKDRGRGRGLPFAFAAIAILAAALGFLLFERLQGTDRVPKDLYLEARSDAGAAAARLAELAALESEARAREAALEDELDRKSGRLSALEEDSADKARRIEKLEDELATKEERLRQYLSVKEMADNAGAFQIENMRLTRENGRLEDRLQELGTERKWLLEQLGRYKMELKGGDPEAIKGKAREMGVLKEPEPADGNGVYPLAGASGRQIKRELNRLFGQAPGEEIYEILEVAGVDGGTTLLDVKVGRYRNQRLLNSLSCKRLEILVNAERDTVELRFKDGAIRNTSNPRERIPLGEDGHSVFLRGVGVKAWLQDVSASVDVGPDGRLTWKTLPS